MRSAVLAAGHGDDYEIVLDGAALPDPCSRWQPAGIRGPSRVLDPGRLRVDRGAPRRRPEDLVLYELHVGAFTPEGTFDTAIEHLAELRELGVTAIELMPVGEFPGRWGWGYDGVYVSAGAVEPTGAPRAAPGSSTPPTRPGLARDPRRGLQPPRGVGRQGDRGLRPLPHRAATRPPWGRAVNLDDADCDPVREWLAAERRGLGPRPARRRPAPRRHPRPARRVRPRPSCASWPTGCTGATTARSSSPSPARTTRASSGPRPRAASGTTPSGPTTSTTRCGCS